MFWVWSNQVNVKLILKYLNNLEKRHRVQVAKKVLVNGAENYTFTKCKINDNDMWVYEDDVETVQQLTEWRSKNEIQKLKVAEGTAGHRSRGFKK